MDGKSPEANKFIEEFDQKPSKREQISKKVKGALLKTGFAQYLLEVGTMLHDTRGDWKPHLKAVEEYLENNPDVVSIRMKPWGTVQIEKKQEDGKMYGMYLGSGIDKNFNITARLDAGEMDPESGAIDAEAIIIIKNTGVTSEAIDVALYDPSLSSSLLPKSLIEEAQGAVAAFGEYLELPLFERGRANFRIEEDKLSSFKKETITADQFIFNLQRARSMDYSDEDQKNRVLKEIEGQERKLPQVERFKLLSHVMSASDIPITGEVAKVSPSGEFE